MSSLLTVAFILAASEPVYKIPVGEGVTRGPERALVTIVEISDFQCPYCKRVAATLKTLEQGKYGPEIRLVFHHNPLAFHGEAMPAALAAEAAGRQGKFWEMHDLLFERQAELGEETYRALALELGLNLKIFDKDRADRHLKQKILDQQAMAVSLGARGTPAFFVNGKKLSGAQPLHAFEAAVEEAMGRALVAIKYGARRQQIYDSLIGDGLTKAAEERPERPDRRPDLPQEPVEIKITQDDQITGAANAPVTIVEFSDFQCPFCARAAATMDRLLKDYPGQVRLVYRHLPLDFHKQADLAARAAEAAGRQGKFWEMHDLLFESYRSLSPEKIDELAKGIPGLDFRRYQQDLESAAIRAKVDADKAEAKRLGVRGTPNFFLNGHRLTGAQPLERFKAKVDELLGQ